VESKRHGARTLLAEKGSGREVVQCILDMQERSEIKVASLGTPFFSNVPSQSFAGPFYMYKYGHNEPPMK